MVHSVVLSEKGQLVIPKRLRDKYGLAKGSKLVIFDENNKLVIEMADSVVEKLKALEHHSQNVGVHAQSGDAATLPSNGDSLERKRDAREIT